MSALSSWERTITLMMNNRSPDDKVLQGQLQSMLNSAYMNASDGELATILAQDLEMFVSCKREFVLTYLLHRAQLNTLVAYHEVRSMEDTFRRSVFYEDQVLGCFEFILELCAVAHKYNLDIPMRKEADSPGPCETNHSNVVCLRISSVDKNGVKAFEVPCDDPTEPVLISLAPCNLSGIASSPCPCLQKVSKSNKSSAKYVLAGSKGKRLRMNVVLLSDLKETVERYFALQEGTVLPTDCIKIITNLACA